MSDDFDAAGDEPDALEMSVAAAMARQYADDSRTFLIELARMLDGALAGDVKIKRAGILGGDNRPVRRIEVDFRDPGDAHKAVRYVIEDDGGGILVATLTQVVRGITLKNDTIPVEEWIRGIGSALSRRAAQSKAARDALTRLLP